MPKFRIHGDNIVECERTLELVARALGISGVIRLRPIGSPLTPTFSLATPLSSEPYHFRFLPGYKRWDQDILEIVRRRGGILREAADAILCRIDKEFEVPLLAIEYCGALPAGNQAWQRSGRALSFAHARLHYVYIAELSGYELTANRDRKAARLPNPAVPFSYLLLTESTKSSALPVFVPSPGASGDALRLHAPFYGERELLEILRCIVLGTPTDAPRKALEAKVLALVRHLAESRHRKDTLSAELWEAAFSAATKGNTLPGFLVQQAPITWSKRASIKGLTSTAKKLMAITARFARGLTSASLPLCLIAEKDRESYAEALKSLYPRIAPNFLKWCRGPGHLVICWVMGFKPRGDDARPDRGLPPFCRMLIGDGTDMLSVVYGPAPKSTWPALRTNPAGLMARNGLWEAVLVSSDAVLIDSRTLPTLPPTTYLRAHWEVAIQTRLPAPFAVTPIPLKAGENDVDTVLHLIFARLAGSDVFEGMCNPPGGDWSGISLLTHDRKLELRWLVLPRVTAKSAKRPDHVVQIFKGFSPFLILAIESKERASVVEPNIGPRLHKYIRKLVRAKPSAQRTPGTAWSHCADTTKLVAAEIATAAAFIIVTEDELRTVAAKANADVVFGFTFSSKNDSCTLHVKPCTRVGEAVASFVAALPTGQLELSINTHA